MIRRALKRIKAILTSYEMVWATPRRAPSKEYLELDAQPAEKVEYTLRLDTHKKKKTENMKGVVGFEVGKIDHRVRAKIRLRVGAT